MNVKEPTVKEACKPLVEFIESDILPGLQFSNPISSAELKVLLNQLKKAVFRETISHKTQTDESLQAYASAPTIKKTKIVPPA